MRTGSLVLAAFALLAVAACGPNVYSVTQTRLYSPDTFRFAAGGKRLLTIVRGNPFGAPRERTEAFVIAAMQRGMLHTDTALVRRPTFTTDVGAAARPEYRVALVLNPAEGIDAATLCGELGDVALAPRAGGILARMAFCHEARVLTTSHGELAGVDDPADPRFRRLIAAMTRQLFPFRDFRGGFGNDGSRTIN